MHNFRVDLSWESDPSRERHFYNWMEKVFEIDLSDDERSAFEDSVAEVKDSIAKLDL